MYYVVMDEEQLPEPYATEAAARAAAERLAREFEVRHGRSARWVIAHEPRQH